MILKGKSVVLGVTGGIAAYKACDVVSRLIKLGATVDVIMTKSATSFVGSLTFQSLTHRPVVTDMFESPNFWEIEHIALAQKADVVVVAPATANIIGKLAGGIADDMLSTTAMATTAPVLIAPAMNTKMYTNPIVQDNIANLRERGYQFVDPTAGRLACDDVGIGKLAQPSDIVARIVALLTPEQLLAGKHIVITAGPTHEAIDPVRFIGNRSTGKMGYALAEQAVALGADVTLISGPSHIERPQGVSFVAVESALELCGAVMKNVASADALISAAAVADYRPKQQHLNKMKKTDGDLTMILERNPDIAMRVAEAYPEVVSIGFSVETQNVIDHSVAKLRRKGFAFIVVNDITQAGAGFAGDTNIVTIIDREGRREDLPIQSKHAVAGHILARLARLL